MSMRKLSCIIFFGPILAGLILWQLFYLNHTLKIQVSQKKLEKTQSISEVLALRPNPSKESHLNTWHGYNESKLGSTEINNLFNESADGFLVSLNYQSMKNSAFFDLNLFIKDNNLENSGSIRRLRLFLEDKTIVNKIEQRNQSIRDAARDIELRMNAIDLLEGIAFTSDIDFSRDEAIKNLEEIAQMAPSKEHGPLARSILYGERHDAITAITRLSPAQGMAIVDSLPDDDRALLSSAVKLGMADLGHLKLYNFLNRVAQ